MAADLGRGCYRDQGAAGELEPAASHGGSL
jgi:hypothetical protein